MGKIRRLQVASRPPNGTWEEQLYLSVGEELWKELTDSKNKCVYLFPNVAKWNDSAAKEALDDAKTRFLAKINKVPCDVPSPDPEAFIDEVDWSDDAIPKVVLEEEESGEWRSEGEVVIEGFDQILDPSFSVGWGPEEWYETKKEEEVVKKDGDEVRKAWEASWGTKAVKAGYSSSRRCTACTLRYGAGGGYPWGQRRMFQGEDQIKYR